ncbi:lactosylceramide 4-alpha-galactosyltransferase-like [Tigriopus californicus]|uniref:lactosylceramide 4-alpha-galactosyltransferase-like n=1 Tax=Tigriopus californicus TaxID=6832 RepID=UPI0027DA1D9E|nr:lactosylceramide 4-alpha-galactosyltransferase-like [Tigriopus californicus]
MLNVENESPLSKDIMRVKSFFPIYACKQVSATAIGLYFICSTFTFLTMDKRAYGRKPPSLRSKNLTSSIEVEPFQESLVDINETVFFLETQESLDELDRSLMCAVESYHGANPFDSIVVLINGGGSIPIVPDYLKDVSQIQFRHLSFAHFLEASPLGELWNSPKWKETIYPLNHMSDLLRVVILHKFGGTYIDSDLIALKAFPRLANNNVIVGVETEKVGSAYMKFGKNHAFLEQAIVELREHFDGSNWGANGPLLLTRVATQKCGPLKIESTGQKCNDFEILPSYFTYPFKARDWKTFFDSSQQQTVREKTAHSYMVHYFSGMRRKEGLDPSPLDPELPLHQLYQAHCPKTWNHFKATVSE